MNIGQHKVVLDSWTMSLIMCKVVQKKQCCSECWRFDLNFTKEQIGRGNCVFGYGKQIINTVKQIYGKVKK